MRQPSPPITPENYCLLADAEVSRAWVAADPLAGPIRYLAPCGRTECRLRRYCVPDERIFLTGLPLPLPHELLCGPDLPTLRRDCAHRLTALDPSERFRALNQRSVDHFLRPAELLAPRSQPLRNMFAIGGAGAQTDIAERIALSLREWIAAGDVALVISCGVRSEVREHMSRPRAALLPEDQDGMSLVYGSTKKRYFDAFSTALHDTHVLWTKPSELSFYCGLGMPVIIALDIGAQEHFNRMCSPRFRLGSRRAIRRLPPIGC